MFSFSKKKKKILGVPIIPIIEHHQQQSNRLTYIEPGRFDDTACGDHNRNHNSLKNLSESESIDKLRQEVDHLDHHHHHRKNSSSNCKNPNESIETFDLSGSNEDGFNSVKNNSIDTIETSKNNHKFESIQSKSFEANTMNTATSAFCIKSSKNDDVDNDPCCRIESSDNISTNFQQCFNTDNDGGGDHGDNDDGDDDHRQEYIEKNLSGKNDMHNQKNNQCESMVVVNSQMSKSSSKSSLSSPMLPSFTLSSVMKPKLSLSSSSSSSSSSSFDARTIEIEDHMRIIDDNCRERRLSNSKKIIDNHHHNENEAEAIHSLLILSSGNNQTDLMNKTKSEFNAQSVCVDGKSIAQNDSIIYSNHNQSTTVMANEDNRRRSYPTSVIISNHQSSALKMMDISNVHRFQSRLENETKTESIVNKSSSSKLSQSKPHPHSISSLINNTTRKGNESKNEFDQPVIISSLTMKVIYS